MNETLKLDLFKSIQTYLCVAKTERTEACIAKVQPLIEFLAENNCDFAIQEYENINYGQHIRGVALITNTGLSIQFSKAGAAIDIALGVMSSHTSIPINPNDDVVAKTCAHFNLDMPNQTIA